MSNALPPPERTPPARYAPFTEERREAFYRLLEETGVLNYSAYSVGVHPKTEYTYRLSNAEHAARVEECIEKYRQSIESEIYRRGVEGINKPLVFQGRLTGDTVREYSDPLLMFKAKRHIPEYREKIDVNQTTRHEGGAPAPLDVRSMTREQRDALRVLLGPDNGPDVEDAKVVEGDVIEDANTIQGGSNTEE